MNCHPPPPPQELQGITAKQHIIDQTYRRNWLLSTCTYNTWQQENMHLTKSMRLTGSMRLIKSAKTQ